MNDAKVIQLVADALGGDSTTLVIICRAGKGPEARAIHAMPGQEECGAYILRVLGEAGGALPAHILDATVRASGYPFSAIKGARRELRRAGAVEYFATGSAKEGDRVWHIRATVRADDDGDTASETEVL